MKHVRYRVLCLLVASFFLLSCTTVPITGRRQFNLIPTQTMLSMSFQQYGQFLKEHQLSTDVEKTRMVQNVGARIQKAVEQYFSRVNMSYKLKDYKWEFNLVESEEVNAWAMPGGKVVFYSGILSYTKDETGIAVVMGHEIAHAVAEHGNERMTQMLAIQLGGVALAYALEEKPQETRRLWMTAFGLGATVGYILPYSRIQENEADRLGLTFMAMAGYDPSKAVVFWERMSQKADKKAPPEFLSTHPSDATRIRNLKRLVPEAMPYYLRATGKS